MTSYKGQLLDPRWQKKRLEIMERDGFKCIGCESATETLHVHHRYYVAKRPIWHYPDAALMTLCKECHRTQGDIDVEEFSRWETLLDMLGNGRPESVDLFYAVMDDYRVENNIQNIGARLAQILLFQVKP